MEISMFTEKYKLKVNLKRRVTFFDLSLWLVEMVPGISRKQQFQKGNYTEKSKSYFSPSTHT